MGRERRRRRKAKNEMGDIYAENDQEKGAGLTEGN